MVFDRISGVIINNCFKDNNQCTVIINHFAFHHYMYKTKELCKCAKFYRYIKDYQRVYLYTDLSVCVISV